MSMSSTNAPLSVSTLSRQIGQACARCDWSKLICSTSSSGNPYPCDRCRKGGHECLPRDSTTPAKRQDDHIAPVADVPAEIQAKRSILTTRLQREKWDRESIIKAFRAELAGFQSIKGSFQQEILAQEKKTPSYCKGKERENLSSELEKTLFMSCCMLPNFVMIQSLTYIEP
jgi:hypothetical protein